MKVIKIQIHLISSLSFLEDIRKINISSYWTVSNNQNCYYVVDNSLQALCKKFLSEWGRVWAFYLEQKLSIAIPPAKWPVKLTESTRGNKQILSIRNHHWYIPIIFERDLNFCWLHQTRTFSLMSSLFLTG